MRAVKWVFVAIGLLAVSPVFAGEQYVDKSGYAVSGYDVVAYFSLPSNAVGETQTPAVPGRTNITAEHNGATFAFSTVENRDLFAADPEKYTPQFNGHCAYGVSRGGKVPANPHLWRIVDGKLYLNITKVVVGFWEENIPKNISKADKKWLKIESKAASKSKIPSYKQAKNVPIAE